jgi:hypothetical protein
MIPTLRPSLLPMLAKSPRFIPADAGEFANDGTIRHEYLAAILAGKFSDVEMEEQFQDGGRLAKLDEKSRDAVQWAAAYIKLNSPMYEFLLLVEHNLNPLDENFEPYFPNGGTCDAACGAEIFDFKWRWFDYEPQMAGYALGRFQETNISAIYGGDQTIRCHVMFGESRKVQRYEFTEETARAIVEKIRREANDESVPCRESDYCSWCQRNKDLTCPIKNNAAEQIASSRKGVDGEAFKQFQAWLERGAHTSEIEDGKLMGAVLMVARSLQDFCDAAEFRAEQLATKQGKEIAGFKLQERKGNRIIASVTEAFQKCGLPQKEFLDACEIRLSSLAGAYAAFHAMKEKTAEREVETKLGEIVQRKPSTLSLVKDKTK